jgi:hypothetical protein
MHEKKADNAHQLHLVLDTEELMLRVEASIGAVRQLCHELVARDEGAVMLVQLIDEGALVVGGGKGEDASVLG